MNTVIKTQGLTKEYEGIKRVDDLNLQIEEGKIYGFLGPNGAGKTTTMKMLLGLTNPTEGEVEILGLPFEPEHRKEILERTGSIIENPSYYGHLTGRENISLLEKMLDLPIGVGDRALELVSLERDKDRKVKEYSLGMKQRLAIAMALVRDPKLLILDEPTNGLDPAGTKEIRELIKKLAHEKGITIMISSHLLPEIEKVADQIGIIDEGKMIFQGTIEELNEYRRPFTILEVDQIEKVKKSLVNFAPQTDGNTIRISDLTRSQRAELVRSLVEHNIKVYAIYEEQQSLEELFLNLTSQEK